LDLEFTVSLKKNDEFKRVYKAGKAARNDCLAVFLLANGLEVNRLGISVSKKMGNAVLRNRQRRRIKEAYRLLETSLCRGYDIVIQPRVRITEEVPFLSIVAGLEGLFKKRGLTGGIVKG